MKHIKVLTRKEGPAAADWLGEKLEDMLKK